MYTFSFTKETSEFIQIYLLVPSSLKGTARQYTTKSDSSMATLFSICLSDF